MRIAKGDNTFGTFSDALTGYRLSSLLLTTARGGLVDALGADGSTAAGVAEKMTWDAAATERFLACLERLGVLCVYENLYQTTPFSRAFFESGAAASQTRAMAFEERLVDTWATLESVLRTGRRVGKIEDKAPERYREDLRDFLGAMDDAARPRAKELWGAFDPPEKGVIVDVGGGSGAYLSEFLERNPGWRGLFCDLRDVVAEAKKTGGLAQFADRVSYVEGNYLDEDFRPPVLDANIVLLSNVLHCQSVAESRGLLKRVVDSLAPDGLLVVHDFFADANWQGALYDLHMLVNTFNGETWTAKALETELNEIGLKHIAVVELPSRSVALFAGRSADILPIMDGVQALERQSRQTGFHHCSRIAPTDIPVAEWVVEKCRFGCPLHGKGGTCPPHDIPPDRMRRILAEYETAIVLAGEPPLRDFQQRLFGLEREALAKGFHKALAFSAGPCSLCDTCRPEHCPHPADRRPALESCGVDVYGLAQQAGIALRPISVDNEFIQYVGLILVK